MKFSTDILSLSLEDSPMTDQSLASPVTNYAGATTTPMFNGPSLRPYPPTTRVGVVESHDVPFFEHGHQGKRERRKHGQNCARTRHYLDRETIARENSFDLAGRVTQTMRKKRKCRMNAESFAITSWTTVPSKT
jgi:hypothetical protein